MGKLCLINTDHSFGEVQNVRRAKGHLEYHVPKEEYATAKAINGVGEVQLNN